MTIEELLQRENDLRNDGARLAFAQKSLDNNPDTPVYLSIGGSTIRVEEASEAFSEALTLLESMIALNNKEQEFVKSKLALVDQLLNARVVQRYTSENPHPNFPFSHWVHEATNENTVLNYHEWVEHRIEEAINEGPGAEDGPWAKDWDKRSATPVPVQDAQGVTDTDRLNHLRNLMGYIEDGSSETVKLHQDDATGSFFVSVGRNDWFGRSFREAIDESMKENNNG